MTAVGRSNPSIRRRSIAQRPTGPGRAEPGWAGPSSGGRAVTLISTAGVASRAVAAGWVARRRRLRRPTIAPRRRRIDSPRAAGGRTAADGRRSVLDPAVGQRQPRPPTMLGCRVQYGLQRPPSCTQRRIRPATQLHRPQTPLHSAHSTAQHREHNTLTRHCHRPGGHAARTAHTHTAAGATLTLDPSRVCSSGPRNRAAASESEERVGKRQCAPPGRPGADDGQPRAILVTVGGGGGGGADGPPESGRHGAIAGAEAPATRQQASSGQSPRRGTSPARHRCHTTVNSVRESRRARHAMSPPPLRRPPAPTLRREACNQRQGANSGSSGGGGGEGLISSPVCRLNHRRRADKCSWRRCTTLVWTGNMLGSDRHSEKRQGDR